MYTDLGLRNTTNCAIALQGLGNVNRRTSCCEEAMSKLEESVGIFGRLGERKSMNCASSLEVIRNVLRVKGMSKEAMSKFEE